MTSPITTAYYIWFASWQKCSPAIPKQQILDSSKRKEFADDNFKFDENSREFSKQVENTVGKGEIARYEQFLIYPQCFQKTYAAGLHVKKKQGLFGN